MVSGHSLESWLSLSRLFTTCLRWGGALRAAAARDLLDDNGGEESDFAVELAEPPSVVDAVRAPLEHADGVALLKSDLIPAKVYILEHRLRHLVV